MDAGRTSERSSSRARIGAALFAAVIGSVPSTARAFEWQFHVEVQGGALAHESPLTLDELDGDLRHIPAGALTPATGPAGYVGVRLGAGVALGSHLVLRFAGIGVAGGVPATHDVLGSADGSILTLQTSQLFLWDFQFAGLTLRTIHRRWLFELTADAAYASLSIPVSVSMGRTPLASSVEDSGIASRVEAAACYRVDISKRACLVGGANLYLFGWWNGGYAALRWEYGK